ncbi:MAG TPA: lytic transglycosylase domain-containing protein [Bacteroidetes bacterium]|nr:lytic transglycosylase domain-containing protein [Bacteroidota bacterium]
MRNTIKYYLAIMAAFATVAIFASYETPTNDPDGTAYNRSIYIPSVDATDEYWFAGERIPTENFDVRERLERELIVNTYYHTSTILNLKKMTRFFPVIEPILKEYGVPEDFKYLAVAESNLSNAKSPVGAKGFWQFMRGTASDYGLQVNTEVDERYHLEKATRAACKYLKKYHEKFGSWINTAAAYNMGPSGFAKEMERQKSDNYFDLNINEETSRYVFRILAIREVLEKPTKFGFDIPEEEKYMPLNNYSVVQVDGAIPNLGDFAKKYGTTYRMLKLYNPWLLSYKLTNSKKKTYDIKIPKQD